MQPVRNIIKESHPEINEKKTLTLFVDGNNLMRISMADPKVNSNGIHYGGVFQFLLQLRILLSKWSFDYVYVVFDGDKSGILRYLKYKDYKSNRDKDYASMVSESDYMKAYDESLRRMQKYIFNKQKKKVKPNQDKESIVDENFSRERDILCACFNELFIRWLVDEEGTEGDDFISYYIHNKRSDDRVVIVSGDEDLTQLISDTVCIYNPRQKQIISSKNFIKKRGFHYENVVLKKILLGDVSDNIKGINGLSENRLIELVPEIKTRPVTLNEVKERAEEGCKKRIEEKKKPLKWQENIVNGVHNGEYDGDFYETNRALIDLNTPLLTDSAKEEISNMMYTAMDPTNRTFENLYKILEEQDIPDLKGPNRFGSFFAPFKVLAAKEIKRYKEQFGE